MALNKVSIMGRITADPELRYVGANSIPTVSFGIACQRDFKNKGTGENETDFFNCTAWRGTAEFITKYFEKGRMIVIDGRLQRHDYEKDGVKHQNVFINVENAYFGDSKNAAGTHAAQSSATATPAYAQTQTQTQTQTQAPTFASAPAPAPVPTTDADGFMNMLPDDDDFPFM